MSPWESPAAAGVTRTAWCQQCIPEIGSGWTGKVRFWCTPVSLHQIRWVSASADSYGPAGARRETAQPSSERSMATVAIIPPTPRGPLSSRQRPMWWLQATTPGRMPSVIHAFATK